MIPISSRSLFVLVALVLSLTCFAASCSSEADRHPLDGNWAAATAEFGGVPFPDEARKSIRLGIADGHYTVTLSGQSDKGTVVLDLTKQPPTVDIVGTEGPNKGRTMLAIFERKGDTLRICYDMTGKARPSEFKTTTGSQLFLVTYAPEKP